MTLAGAVFMTVPSLALAHENEDKAVPVASLSPAERTKIERMLDKELTDTVKAFKLIEGQRGFNIRTKLVPGRDMVTVDLGGAAVPNFHGSESEDQQAEIRNVITELLKGVVQFEEIDYTYAGHRLRDILPDVAPPVSHIPRELRNSASSNGPMKVAVAAGHGIYYHHHYKDWRAQRDEHNGITEDFITPEFAKELGRQLGRANAQVFQARLDSKLPHTESGEEAWKLAARYWLESRYPQNKSIWNSLPNATHSLRERDEDIRSRPLFANHVGADYAIHLHSDGASSSAARGTRALVASGRAADKKLADQILCTMRKTIQSTPGYETWEVASSATADPDKGENNHATMPSVIVELGFHTNKDDAIALQDSDFQEAATKGIERGISDYHKNEDCADVKITQIPSFSSIAGQPMDMVIHFEGNPRMPVKLHTRNITCTPSNWTCGDSTTTILVKSESTMKRTFKCMGNPSNTGNFTYAAWLVDASGIKSNEFEYSYSCKKAA